MHTTAILTAAGSGSRLGADLPKALVSVSGVPLFVHAARGLAASEAVDSLIITCPPGYAALFAEALGTGVGLPVTLVDGAATRHQSVAAAVRALPPECDVALVHDAARPFATPALTEQVVAAVRSGLPAVIPGLPVTDTVKQVDDAGRVVATIPREPLRTVQTPQGFTRDVLARAHAAGSTGVTATDDAALVEALGEPVTVIDGELAAMKITTPWDLTVASLLGGETS